MDDQEFLNRIRAKIERLAGREIGLHMDPLGQVPDKGEFTSSVPQVALGSDVLNYPGFARMAIEYVVAALREDRELGTLEFHMLLARN